MILLSCFKENEELADSVNHLLLVGFYLVIRGDTRAAVVARAAGGLHRGVGRGREDILGVVLLVLGFMHFFNMLIFAKLRERAENRNHNPYPPALPANAPREAWRDELRK